MCLLIFYFISVFQCAVCHHCQGPRSKFSSGGAKEECVKENFWGGGRGGMLVDFYSISLK